VATVKAVLRAAVVLVSALVAGRCAVTGRSAELDTTQTQRKITNRDIGPFFRLLTAILLGFDIVMFRFYSPLNDINLRTI
jgi:hypothetical protein